FVSHADELYGPITTLRKDGRLVKHIRWDAFRLSDGDWGRIKAARDILEDSNRVQQVFSGRTQPTLWRALPVIEELQTRWEKRLKDPLFAPYHSALEDGLGKLRKYYSRFDEKPAYILALVLHPYFKLTYIKLAWGGAEEQEAEIAKGNIDAKNWQDEALRVVETTVKNIYIFLFIIKDVLNTVQMEEYWKTRPRKHTEEPPLTAGGPSTGCLPEADTVIGEYERYCQTLAQNSDDESWQAELRRYLKEVTYDVSPETDIVNWWQVCIFNPFSSTYRSLIYFALLGEWSLLSDANADCAGCPTCSCIFSTM
ncbi:hypothetical protein JOM56_003788, partial [Amanita muscaria]